MPWFKVDDKWWSHPKTIEISLAASGLWARAGSWCADQLTDGHVPEKMLRVFGAKKKHADELTEAGLWKKVDKGWQFHEWSTYQPSRADVIHDRELKAERQRRWREAKALERKQKEQVVDGTVDASTTASRNPSRDGGVEPAPNPTRPDPTRPHRAPNGALDDCEGLTPPPQTSDSLELVTPPLPAKRKPKQPTASSEAWKAYAEAYRERYGCDPIRNAKVNGQLSQFVQRVPRDEAPQIVRHYLRSHNARYTASGHSVGCLLQDAEKLRTEALTGRATTSYAARQADAKQGRGQKYAGVIAKLEREAEEEERQAREVSSGNA